VDKKLAAMMAVGLLAGVQTAVKINSHIFESLGRAASNLYISTVFIVVLTAIAVVIFIDLRRKSRRRDSELLQKIQRIRIPPVVHFETAMITVSLWFPLLIAFATGYLAGTIGVGGFIGVPAMIYLLGISTRVAAGTELFLAIFSGAWGAINYALLGYVDLRLVVLLYLGSLIGVQIGAIATEIVEQRVAKLALLTVIATSDVGRIVMVPEYLRRMGYLSLNEAAGQVLSLISMLLLFGGAVVAIGVVFRELKRVAALNRGITTESHFRG
jgi:hypothetical protein